MASFTSCFSVLLLVAWVADSLTDPAPLVFPGQVSIGILINLHDQIDDVPARGSISKCGRIRPDEVKKLMAALWTVQLINSKKEQDDFIIGIQAFDACGSEDMAVRQAVKLVHQGSAKKCNSYDRTVDVIGVLSIGKTTDTVPRILSDFSVPNIMTTELTEDTRSPTTFSARPSVEELVEVVEDVVNRLRVKELSIVTAGRSGGDFLAASMFKSGLEKTKVVGTERTKKDLATYLETFDPQDATAILFMDVEEAIGFIDEASGSKFIRWIIATTSSEDPKINTTRLHPNAEILLVRPEIEEMDEFEKYFAELIRDPRGRQLKFLAEYIKFKESDDVESARVAKSEIGDPQSIAGVVKSILGYALALRAISRANCHHGVLECAPYLKKRFNREIYKTLSELDHVQQKPMVKELNHVRLDFGFDGQGSLRHPSFHIFQLNLTRSVRLGLLGSFSKDKLSDRMNFDDAARKWDLLEDSPRATYYRMEAPLSNNLLANSKIDLKKEDDDNLTSDPVDERRDPFVQIISRRSNDKIRLTEWMERPTVLVVLVLSGIGLLVSLYIVVFVSVKLCDGTLIGNQGLGILQLLSVTAMYLTSMMFVVLKPSGILCSGRHFVMPICYVVAYAVMIVKLMQLQSLVKIGLGGRVNQVNQYLTLFFIVGVQVALSIQWSVLRPETVSVGPDGIPFCSITKTAFILSNLYPLFLLIVALALAISTRHIRRNYNEGQGILLTASLAVPIWIIWIVVYSFVDDHHYNDVCLGLANFASATVILSVIFGPKLVTISKQSEMFKHKKLSTGYPDSVSTLFSHLNDLDTLSAGTMSEKSINSTSSGYVTGRGRSRLSIIRRIDAGNKGSSASRKSPKTLQANSLYDKSDDGIVTLNPLYEPLESYRTNRMHDNRPSS